MKMARAARGAPLSLQGEGVRAGLSASCDGKTVEAERVFGPPLPTSPPEGERGRRRALLSAFLALICVLFAAAPASAHTKSETHSVWRVVANSVHVTFSVPDIEAKRLANPDGSPPSDARLAGYLAARLSVLNDKTPCPRAGPVQATSAAPGFRRFELTFRCPSAKDMKLHSDAFFDLVPSHVTFAQVVTSNGDFVEQLISKDERTLDASATEGKLQNASFLDFVKMGMMHIFTGIDHISFILGFVIIARNLRDLLFVVTGFTIGHSLTLALAVTGIIRPHPEYIDALIGLTIAVVGAENIAVASGKPAVVGLSIVGLVCVMALIKVAGFGGLPVLLLFGAGIFASNYLMLSGHLKDAARIRLVVTLVFGLIHGFGFAANLLDERLPKGRLAELIFGFNVGVELGQMAVVLAVVGSVALLAKVRLTLPRPLVIDVVSSGLVAFGLLLFTARSYGVPII